MGYSAVFEEGRWNRDDFLTTGLYYMFPSNREFEQHDGYIANGRAPDAPGDGQDEFALLRRVSDAVDPDLHHGVPPFFLTSIAPNPQASRQAPQARQRERSIT